MVIDVSIGGGILIPFLIFTTHGCPFNNPYHISRLAKRPWDPHHTYFLLASRGVEIDLSLGFYFIKLLKQCLGVIGQPRRNFNF